MLSDGRRADTDVMTRVADALVRAWQSTMDRETRCVYFVAVEQLVKFHGDLLNNADLDRLIPALVDAWKSQRCDSHLFDETINICNNIYRGLGCRSLSVYQTRISKCSTVNQGAS